MKKFFKNLIPLLIASQIYIPTVFPSEKVKQNSLEKVSMALDNTSYQAEIHLFNFIPLGVEAMNCQIYNAGKEGIFKVNIEGLMNLTLESRFDAETGKPIEYKSGKKGMPPNISINFDYDNKRILYAEKNKLKIFDISKYGQVYDSLSAIIAYYSSGMKEGKFEGNILFNGKISKFVANTKKETDSLEVIMYFDGDTLAYAHLTPKGTPQKGGGNLPFPFCKGTFTQSPKK